MSEEAKRAIDLSDAKEWLDRAKRLSRELEETLHGGNGLWQLRETADREERVWRYTVTMDRSKLKAAKWIINEAANCVSSSLDHIAAAIAKSRSDERHKRLYFPWGFTDEAFQAALKRYEPALGAEWSKVLEEARKKQQMNVHHVEAAKEIANSGKHWEVLIPLGSMLGIQMITPEGRRMFELPKDAFKESDVYEYHRDKERLPCVPVQVVIGVTIEGLSEGLPQSPDTILACAFRFVDGQIEAVEKAA